MSMKRHAIMLICFLLFVSAATACGPGNDATPAESPGSDAEIRVEPENSSDGTKSGDKTEIHMEDPPPDNLRMLYPDFDSEVDALLSDENQTATADILDGINSVRSALGLEAVAMDIHLSLCAYKSADLVAEYGKLTYEGVQEIDDQVIDGIYLDKYRQGKTCHPIRKFSYTPDFSGEQMLFLLDEIFVPETEVVEIGIGIAPAGDGYYVCVYTAIPQLHQKGEAEELECFRENVLHMINASRYMRGLELLEYDADYNEAAMAISVFMSGVGIQPAYEETLSYFETVKKVVYSGSGLPEVHTHLVYYPSSLGQEIISYALIAHLIREDVVVFGVGMAYNELDMNSDYYVTLCADAEYDHTSLVSQ